MDRNKIPQCVLEINASNKRSLRGKGQDGETKRCKINKGDHSSNGHRCGYRRMEEDFVQDGVEYSVDTSIHELII
jgi:hypothetical protein